jgi:hypothetical protein
VAAPLSFPFGKKKLNEGPMMDVKWSQKEKSISRAGFEKALKNEYNDIIETVKKKVANLSEPKQIWELEDYLYKKRKEIDNKYDYRYSALIPVFGRLVREGWITLKELEGLEEEKIQRIKLIATMDV